MLPVSSMRAAQVSVDPVDLTMKSSESSEQIIDPNNLLSRLKKLRNQIDSNSRRLNLQESVAKGLQNNPILLQQFSLLQEKEWQLISNRRKWNPALSIANTPGGLVGYNWNTYVVNNYAQKLPNKKITSRSQKVQFNPVATIKWTFWDPSRQSSINAAQTSLDQQKYLLDQSARGLVSEIEILYFKVQQSRQLMDSFSQIYKINKKQLDILEARRGIGMTNIADVEQQRSNLYIQLTTLVLYTKNYIQQTASLAKLLSLSGNTVIVPSEGAKPHGIWHKSLEETIEDALILREDILALTSQAETQKWQGISLMRKYLPVFSFVAQGILTSSNGYPQTPLQIDPGSKYQTLENWNMTAGIGFNWQFDGGQNAAIAQSNFANSRSVLASKAMAENQAVNQVRASFGKMNTSKIAIQAAQESYRSAVIAQEAARARFDVGVGDITSVIQAVTQLSSASTQLASAILNYNSSISQLYRYSATWPKGAKKEYSQRLDFLRESTSP